MKDKGETDKIMNGRELKLLKCKVNGKSGDQETRLQRNKITRHVQLTD
jgi:hypothetical protein